MKYDIYFHGGCFDGVASAAMLLWFLRQRGDDYKKFTPLTHPVDKKWWRALKMKNPSAITDILYHPKASIWFDHHPTTFIEKKWEEKFRKDDRHVLDTTSPSCTSLIYRHYTKNKNFKIPKHIKDLVRWADIIDRNLLEVYHTPKDAVNLISGAVGVAKSFVDKKPSVAYAKFLIKALCEMPFSKIVKLLPVKKRINIHKSRLKKSFGGIEERLVLYGSTAILYGMSKMLTGARFAPYYFYPEAKYSIRILKRGRFYVASVGINPWNKPKNLAHIGKFLAKNYGKISAGGHAVAASASFGSKKEVLEGAISIADYLNKHV